MWDTVSNVLILIRVDHLVWNSHGCTDVAILFLCSKEAKWITGIVLPIDAGVSSLLIKIDVPKFSLTREIHSQTTAGRADRPALKADTLAENNTGISNSKL
jgi:hypothetical protein